MEKISQILLKTTRLALNRQGYRSRFVKFPFGHLHYYDARGFGQLPPMVFLHGLSSHGAELAPLFKRLRRHSQRLIVVDLPVHGFSQMPLDQINNTQINQLFLQGLDQILAPLPPALIFGNSLGGMAAIRYANHAPENVAMQVLASPGGAYLPPEKMDRLFQFFLESTQNNPGLFVDKLFNRPPRLKKLVELEVKARFARPEMQAYISQWDPHDHVKPEELQNIQAPTLMIWGKQDRLLEAHVEYHRRHIPDHFRLEEPEHFTHSPYLEGKMDVELANKILHWALRHSDRSPVFEPGT